MTVQTKAAKSSRRSRFVTGAMLALGIAVLAGGIAFRLGDLHAQTVLSGSMRPTANPGDVAITQGVPLDQLRVGDVITFTPPNQTLPVMHRIASLENGSVTTRGDANFADDPWRIRLVGPTAYRLVFVVPYIGWLTQFAIPFFVGAGLLAGLAVARFVWKGVTSRPARSRPQSQT